MPSFIKYQLYYFWVGLVHNFSLYIDHLYVIYMDYLYIWEFSLWDCKTLCFYLDLHSLYNIFLSFGQGVWSLLVKFLSV